MYPAGVQMRPRQLWTVTQAAVVTNERANGITGLNPVRIDEHYVAAIFHIRVTVRTIALAGVRIYGAVAQGGGFPTPGNAAEVLVSTATNINAGEGLLRVPALHAIDADTKFPCQVVPRFLLLEYDTAGAGTVTFIVDATFIGPLMGGRS